MSYITKKQFTTSALWKMLESFSSKGISFIVSIILARILMPKDYGIIALVGILINLSDILIDGGFSTTLIRKKTVDDCDYSCLLITSIAIAIVLYCIFFFTAPYVALYYNEPKLEPVLRVMSLTLLIQAFSATRTALVNRNMQFKLLCYSNIAGSSISGIIGIVAAYLGLGVWALVIQRLLQQALITIFLFIKIRWKIKWSFSFERLKENINFSIGVVGASLIYFLGGNIYGIVIGKFYSVTDLGYYSKGSQLPEQASLYTFSAISSVLLPTLSTCQDDRDRVKHIIRKVMNMTSFLIFPIMIGLMVISKEVIVLLLTSKWLPATGIMRSWCLYYMAMPFSLISIQVFYALGHSFTRVKTEVIRLIMMSIGLVVFSLILRCNIEQLSFVGACVMVVSTINTVFESSRMISYKCLEIFNDIWKPLMSSAIMGLIVAGIGFLLPFYGIDGIVLPLTIKVATGATIYFFFSLILKMDGFNEITIMLRNFKQGR